MPLEPGMILTKDQCPKTPREFDRMQNVPYNRGHRKTDDAGHGGNGTRYTDELYSISPGHKEDVDRPRVKGVRTIVVQPQG